MDKGICAYTFIPEIVLGIYVDVLVFLLSRWDLDYTPQFLSTFDAFHVRVCSYIQCVNLGCNN